VAGAVEKYETALRLDPRDDETWNLLGGARLEAAELSEETTLVGGSLQQAYLAADHFKTACRLNPDDPDHWAKWGQALFKIAQIVDNEASALAALEEAEEKYLTAVALDPEEGEHRTGLSHILYQWGWRTDDPELKRARFRKAYDHCAEAGHLSPHDPTVWRNWAQVAEALAGLEIDPRLSVDWQNEANEKSYYADTLETPASRSRRH
jgi:cytochrome c-type biogenesis protein CcmH/NrfG